MSVCPPKLHDGPLKLKITCVQDQEPGEVLQAAGRAESWCFANGFVPKVNWLYPLNLLSSKEHATHTETLCPKFVVETRRGKSGMLGCGLAVVSSVTILLLNTHLGQSAWKVRLFSPQVWRFGSIAFGQCHCRKHCLGRMGRLDPITFFPSLPLPSFLFLTFHKVSSPG